MAGTITATAQLQDQVTGGANESAGTSQAQFSQTGSNVEKGTLSTSTTPTQIPIGSIGTLGFLYVKNLDPTNAIGLRMGSGGTNFCTLLPGEFALFPTAGTSPYAVAAAGTPSLFYMATEA